MTRLQQIQDQVDQHPSLVSRADILWLLKQMASQEAEIAAVKTALDRERDAADLVNGDAQEERRRLEAEIASLKADRQHLLDTCVPAAEVGELETEIAALRQQYSELRVKISHLHAETYAEGGQVFQYVLAEDVRELLTDRASSSPQKREQEKER